MSGVLVIVERLKASAPLIAQVPAARIMAGDVPQGTGLPAIGVTLVSSVPLVVNVDGTVTTHRDRVQVSVLAKTYTSLRTIMPLVFASCPHVRGTINGVKCDSIIPGAEGPDFSDEEVKFFSRTRDFVVTWTT